MSTFPVVCVVFLILIGSLPLLQADHPPAQTTQATRRTTMPDHFHTAISYLPEALETCVEHLKNMIKAEMKHAEHMHSPGYEPRKNSFSLIQSFKGGTAYDKQLSFASYLQTSCLTIIKERFSLSNAQMKGLLPYLPPILHKDPSTSPKWEALRCPYPMNVTCSPVDVYRTYDGRCNNLVKPLWGSSHQPLARFLPPDYADAISKPRVSYSGKELPNARLVRSAALPHTSVPDYLHPLMLMQMGQYLDHDITRTAISRLAANAEGTELEDVECGQDGCQTEGPENLECFPIIMPKNDPGCGSRKPCLMFVRSQGVPNENCDPGPRENVNQLTSFLDASQVYGSSEEEALDLREISADRGRMKVTNHPAGGYKPLLPLNPKVKSCRLDHLTELCFKAGDGRVNEWTGLTSQHTIWVREHNRIEQKLHELNPHWDGERLYQETRRIVIAIWQFSIFNEYLPTVVGTDTMYEYDLQLVDTGYWNGYDESINPNIANSFATAAYRFGHTMIPGYVRGRDSAYNVVKNVTFSTLFYNPHLVWEQPWRGMDMVMMSLVGDSSQSVDRFLTEQVTCHLFSQNPPHELGEDLAAINIQRGRDHGIPGYNWFREWCGLKKASSFDDLVDIPAGVVNEFRQLYGHVDDIDLWPAGISEQRKKGAGLGPTFTCVIARQFYKLKHGDRFWFENNLHNPHPFTEAQLAEIRKFKYAKVMCENADHLPHIQPEVFFHPRSVMNDIVRRENRQLTVDEIEYMYGRGANERVPCDLLPEIDLQLWVESPSAADHSKHGH